MTNLVDLVGRVRRVATDLRGIFKQVDSLLAPRMPATKQVPVEISLAIPFLTGDFNVKTASYTNGGDDIYLTRLGCDVQMVRPAPVPLPSPDFIGYDLEMYPDQQGFYPWSSKEDGNVAPSPYFDFAWNYQIASVQAFYGSPANNVPLLTRGSLGNSDSGEGNTLEQPGQLLRAGDTITFHVQPVLFPIPGLDPNDGAWPYNGTSFVVNMFAIGRRGGVMAEAAYDRR